MDDFKKNSKDYVGETYNYAANLRGPRAIGMSDEGDLEVLSNDIAGLMAYTKVLVEGGGYASSTGRPMGNSYFLKTMGSCIPTDLKGNSVKISDAEVSNKEEIEMHEQMESGNYNFSKKMGGGNTESMTSGRWGVGYENNLGWGNSNSNMLNRMKGGNNNTIEKFTSSFNPMGKTTQPTNNTSKSNTFFSGGKNNKMQPGKNKMMGTKQQKDTDTNAETSEEQAQAGGSFWKLEKPKRKTKRYIYINNIPQGKLDLPGLDKADFSDFRGLIPGILNNIISMNPANILGGLTESTDPSCAKVTLDVVDTNNNRSKESKFVALSDIKSLNPCVFGGDGAVNPLTGDKCGRAGFANMQKKKMNGYKKPVGLKKNGYVNAYNLSVGLFFMYLLYKVLKKN